MGTQRTCVKFAKTKNRVFRCKEYESASDVGKHPKPCPEGMKSRSHGLIHLKTCLPGHGNSEGGGRRSKRGKRKGRRR
jgi:hypothetical protein